MYDVRHAASARTHDRGSNAKRVPIVVEERAANAVVNWMRQAIRVRRCSRGLGLPTSPGFGD
jgi:hypothetical protein